MVRPFPGVDRSGSRKAHYGPPVHPCTCLEHYRFEIVIYMARIAKQRAREAICIGISAATCLLSGITGLVSNQVEDENHVGPFRHISAGRRCVNSCRRHIKLVGCFHRATALLNAMFLAVACRPACKPNGYRGMTHHRVCYVALPQRRRDKKASKIRPCWGRCR